MAGMLIVGAGECGTRAALALREAGYAGPVTLHGAELHPPYERPPLSKDALFTESPSPKPIGGSERLADAAIDFRPGLTATEIDRAARVVRCDGAAELAYDKLLIATGARPRTLPAADGAMTLRTLDDAAAIRAALGPGRRLAVIGGGFIGLELAASARRLGAEVAVIEALPRLLTRGVPAEIAAALHARHLEEDVRFHFGARISELSPRGVALADGPLVPADLVVVGIGAVPNTELGAAAGLAADNGLAADATLATSDPAIFAAGDCCSSPHPLYDDRRLRLESWRSAQEQGTLAARNMLGHAEPTSAVPWFWSDQYDLTLQIAGLADGAAATVRRELDPGAFVLFHLAADGRLLSGIGRGNAVAKDIRLAEMLVARRARPDPAALADPAQNLKRML
jgi:3-phenylpropionate/trans-cinnamate dioxygenase ferredoxin reductase subunit